MYFKSLFLIKRVDVGFKELNNSSTVLSDSKYCYECQIYFDFSTDCSIEHESEKSTIASVLDYLSRICSYHLLSVGFNVNQCFLTEAIDFFRLLDESNYIFARFHVSMNEYCESERMRSDPAVYQDLPIIITPKMTSINFELKWLPEIKYVGEKPHKLRHASIWTKYLEDTHLVPISDCTELETIYFNNDGVRYSTFIKLIENNPNLRKINCSVDIPESDEQQLFTNVMLPNLSELETSFGNVSEFKLFAQLAPNVKILKLYSYNDSLFPAICPFVNTLEELEIYDLDAEGVITLSDCEQLMQLKKLKLHFQVFNGELCDLWINEGAKRSFRLFFTLEHLDGIPTKYVDTVVPLFKNLKTINENDV